MTRFWFAWQRGADVISGGLMHGTNEESKARGKDVYGTWVAAFEALAEQNWGSKIMSYIFSPGQFYRTR
jgi:hypothetical protein